MSEMSATISQAGPDTRGERITQSPRATPLDAIRAFAVVFGGAIALDAAAVGAALSCANAIRRRRRPRALALAGVGAAAAYLTAVRPWMRRWGATAEELDKP